MSKRKPIKLPIIGKYFLYDKITGKNNVIRTLIKGKWRNIVTKPHDTTFFIKGDNNIINFHFKTKSLPKGLNLKIKGSNNVIDIYKTSFENTVIRTYRDGNKLEIKEQCRPIVNAHIFVSYGGSMFIGRDCELNNGGLELIVHGDYDEKHKMIIGDDVRIARDAIIRTSDGQSLLDPETMIPLDPPEDIIIGNHVWIMSRCTILKGTHLPNGCAVAANSLVNKKFEEENLLICGTPAKIMRRNIRWGEAYGKEMERVHQEKMQETSQPEIGTEVGTY